MIETKELAPIRAQVTKLETQAQSVQIVAAEDYESAITLVGKLKETASEIKQKKESITKPLNEALRNARELFAPIEEQFERAEAIVKTKLLDYKRKKDTEAREAEAKIAARVEKGTLKIETAERKLDQVERVETTTKSSSGHSVQVRKVKKVRIVDAAALPREYLIPDDVLIRKDALAGKVIAGVEVYEDEIISAY